VTETTPRMTKQRAAVIAVLRQGGFRSAQDWHERLRHEGSSAGLATVYRALQVLSDSGDVDTVVTESGETLYRLCGAPEVHHHHLRCRVCGAAEDIDMPSIESWASKIGAEFGYSRIEHVVELTGVCAQCAKEGN